MDAARIWKLVRQRAHPGCEAIPPPVLRKLHVQHLDDELVARHRAFDRDRAGEEVRSFAGRHACEHIAMLRQDAKA
jgi:hypothetical protein